MLWGVFMGCSHLSYIKVDSHFPPALVLLCHQKSLLVVPRLAGRQLFGGCKIETVTLVPKLNLSKWSELASSLGTEAAKWKPLHHSLYHSDLSDGKQELIRQIIHMAYFIQLLS